MTIEVNDEGLSEWQCPSCGATTRARMADHPAQPEQPDGCHCVHEVGCPAGTGTPFSAQPDRETLARIIDPDAWGNYGYDLNGYQRRRALGRADAVIAHLRGR